MAGLRSPPSHAAERRTLGGALCGDCLFCRFIQSPSPRSCWCADVPREQSARMVTVARWPNRRHI
eukprot:scaffold619540_cov43-Prasinocladus_malaysianus.AAC.1